MNWLSIEIELFKNIMLKQLNELQIDRIYPVFKLTRNTRMLLEEKDLNTIKIRCIRYRKFIKLWKNYWM